MPDDGGALSRNPNVCASCSSMADGMEESNLPEGETLRHHSGQLPHEATESPGATLEGKVAEPASQEVPAAP